MRFSLVLRSTLVALTLGVMIHICLPVYYYLPGSFSPSLIKGSTQGTTIRSEIQYNHKSSWGASISPMRVLQYGVEECVMIKAKGFSGESYNYCIRPYDDLLSKAMRRIGRWPDCDVLDSLWDGKSLASPIAQKQSPKFLDVGSNTGACLCPMISKGVYSIAFEPAPTNLFYLTSTILANKGFSNLLELFPYAASDANNKNQTIYVARDNAGNAVIDKPIGDFKEQKFDKFQVESVKLDYMLWPDPNSPPPHIKLMKLDAQGWEMHVLMGGKRLFKAGCIGIIKFEVANDWLQGQGTSAKDLLYMLVDLGFGIFTENLSLQLDSCHFCSFEQGIHELQARLRNKEVDAKQSDCPSCPRTMLHN